MADKKATPEAKAKKTAKTEKLGGAKAIHRVARAISGLDKEKWESLAKDARKEHMKAAKRVLVAQNKLASKPEKEAKAGKEAR